MVNAGDIIRVKDGVDYTVTKSGTKWLCYEVSECTVLIGTLPFGDHKPADMIRLYGNPTYPSHKQRRFEAGVKLYRILTDEVELAGNNAFFKNKLIQGDIWEDPKPRIGHMDFFNAMFEKHRSSGRVVE